MKNEPALSKRSKKKERKVLGVDITVAKNGYIIRTRADDFDLLGERVADSLEDVMEQVESLLKGTDKKAEFDAAFDEDEEGDED
jgi:hypothetical protein